MEGIAPISTCRRPPKSGYYGVTSDKKRWRAEIYFGGIKKTLGTFGIREEAAFAYDVEQGNAFRKNM
jgi:hypothetical protein